MDSNLTPDRADILLLTALTEEQHSLRRAFGMRFEPRFRHGTAYHCSRLERGDRFIDLVEVSQLDRGPVTAAVTAAKAICHWQPAIVVMTGICAGVRGVCDLGDIVVATSCFEHLSGQLVDGSIRPERKKLSIMPWLQAYLSSIAADPDLAPKIRSLYPGETPVERSPTIRFGSMVSGPVVVKDRKFLAGLVAEDPSVVALDMESYGVALAASLCSSAHRMVQALIVKAVVDFADETKGDEWHDYGSFASGMLVKALIDQTLDRAAAYENLKRAGD